MKYPIWLKYNLKKDHSAIWQGCKNEEEYLKNKDELQKLGYNPMIDNSIKP